MLCKCLKNLKLCFYQFFFFRMEKRMFVHVNFVCLDFKEYIVNAYVNFYSHCINCQFQYFLYRFLYMQVVYHFIPSLLHSTLKIECCRLSTFYRTYGEGFLSLLKFTIQVTFATLAKWLSFLGIWGCNLFCWFFVFFNVAASLFICVWFSTQFQFGGL